MSAIANQTEILRGCIARAKSGSLTDGSDLGCSYALKWVTHFMGDITQPLHASGIAAGGNDFDVTFGNHSTELHAVSVSNPQLAMRIMLTKGGCRCGTATSSTRTQT